MLSRLTFLWTGCQECTLKNLDDVLPLYLQTHPRAVEWAKVLSDFGEGYQVKPALWASLIKAGKLEGALANTCGRFVLSAVCCSVFTNKLCKEKEEKKKGLMCCTCRFLWCKYCKSRLIPWLVQFDILILGAERKMHTINYMLAPCQQAPALPKKHVSVAVPLM